MGKQRASVKAKDALRHDPLHVQMSEDGQVGRKKNKKSITDADDDGDENEQAYVDAKLSKKILRIAWEQQAEEEGSSPVQLEQVLSTKSSFLASDSEDEEVEEHDLDDVEELEIDEADADVLAKFMPSAPRERKTLADLIMEKIEAHNAEGDQEAQEDEEVVPPGMHPRVVEVYTQVGHLLSRYKSGKLPKAFKFITRLRNWEEVLFVTHPEKWTPNAHYEATRIFVSSLTAQQAQKYLQYILLDRVRDDIAETKKLNYHLYMALKKSLYKPAAFFKGILFPLCKSGTCTLKEAAIIGSVLTKVSVPVLHSSAALLRLAQMDYTGPNSLFIRVLLDKKYALPYKVIDALVQHFCNFKTDPRRMPVLWHQALLVFAQRYKQDIVPEQKDALLDVIKVKSHEGITPEIRRELVSAVPREEMMDALEEDMMLMSD
ncbi:hypothetical protein BZG36_04626 [Bifiguratus adelaidae]|uniref:Bystin n=1 Tax=Bifiguratus adelaidae TaxID=1938954 RepID=A0A261XXI9_9FUNG|nr:hypothetical protein BZG36_04626 [Bifiguratus adelaidae]